jgi:formylglycine-generating enzyme required for sulfatase activity
VYKKKVKIFIISISIILVAGITSVIVKAVDNRITSFNNKNSGPCANDMVYISFSGGGFCIDKYEASPGLNCAYQEVSNQNETRVNLSQSDCQPISLANARPWRFISQAQAMSACAKAGKRLPTDEEWYLASLGTPDKEKDWTMDDCQVKNNWDSQPGLTSSAKNCVSAAGAYDMIGNIWEWVKGEIKNGYYNDTKLPPSGYIKSVDTSGLPLETDIKIADPNFNGDYLWIKDTETRGIARGGYWNNQGEAGIYSMYLVSLPSFTGTGVGFRCAK